MERKRQELHELLAKADLIAKELHSNIAVDSAFRTEVVQQSKRVTQTLQTPVDQAWEIFFQPHHLSTLQTALEAGWLHAINEAGEAGITADELAKKSAADPILIKRLMRFLTATGSIEEVEVNTYAATPMSKFFCTPHMGAGLRHAGHDYAVAISRMPEYLANNGYQPQPNAEYGMYTYARGTSYLRYLSQRPEIAHSFNTFMAAAKAGKKSWLDVFPLEKLRVSSSEDIMLVDVGGGKGHELVTLAERMKQRGMNGKLILQDLPKVTSEVPSHWHEFFTAHPHDFLKPQPISLNGARAFYMRNICHGWSDRDCITILRYIRSVMKPGYSTLLINEIVLPDIGCSFWQAAFDITMMAMVCGRERTKLEWEELVQSVNGLRIEKIWVLEAKGESLIEIIREE